MGNYIHPSFRKICPEVRVKITQGFLNKFENKENQNRERYNSQIKSRNDTTSHQEFPI